MCMELLMKLLVGLCASLFFPVESNKASSTWSLSPFTWREASGRIRLTVRFAHLMNYFYRHKGQTGIFFQGIRTANGNPKEQGMLLTPTACLAHIFHPHFRGAQLDLALRS